MNDFLTKLIERKQSEMDELKKRSDESQDLAEVRAIGEVLEKLAEEIAEAKAQLEELDKEKVLIAFRILSKEQAGEAFSYMDPDMKEKLIHNLTDIELKEVMDELFMDDAVDLIEEMPSNVVKRILRAVSKDYRKAINELDKYDCKMLVEEISQLRTLEDIEKKLKQFK